jgi:UMF1 family MFS transporter
VVAVANTAFEMGQVFYNAMLPDVAPKEKLGRVSGWAWSLGYFGGLAALAAVLVLFVQTDEPLFGLDKTQAEHVRIAGPFVAFWLALFALPLFFFTPDRPRAALSMSEAARRGLSQLRRSLGNLWRDHRQITLFLISRMLYIDGLNTLFVFGGIYAAGSFGMDTEEILIFGLLLNVTSGLGALAFAWVDDWIGPKRTILISIVALSLLGGAILIAETKLAFYILGAAIGVFIGPTQSASRSMMAHMAPEEIRTELFGLYAFSGKATAFLGPLVVGWVTLVTANQRWGMATILIFFLAGGLLLTRVKPAA